MTAPKKSSPARFAAIAAALFGGCTAETELLESTTTTIAPGEHAIARSADGRVSLDVTLSGLDEGAEITIATRRDLQPNKQLGLAYEISSKHPMWLARSAELRFSLDGIAAPQATTVGVVDGERLVAIDGVSRLDGALSLPVRGLSRATYALVNTVADVCAGRVCGDPCRLTTTTSSSCLDSVETYCDQAGQCVPGAADLCGPLPATPEGYDEPVGQGAIFVVSSMSVAALERGFDLDVTCGDPEVDNALSPLGALLNEDLRQAVLGGDLLTVIELAGIDPPHATEVDWLTVKLYSAVDHDDPANPADDFHTPPGHTDCCRFDLRSESITGVPPNARSRMVARIAGGQLATLSPAPAELMWFPTANAAPPPRPALRLELVHLAGSVSEAREQLDLVMGAVISANGLAMMTNPYCRTASPECPLQLTADTSMLDLVTALVGQPDVDLDRDGLETFVDEDGDGLIDRCFDGCVGACAAPEEITMPGNVPCTVSPRVADGYSITFDVTAVAAMVTGIR